MEMPRNVAKRKETEKRSDERNGAETEKMSADMKRNGKELPRADTERKRVGKN